MNCCSMGLAISKVVHVNTPAQVLWDVLTDLESLPDFVDAITSLTVKLPKLPSISSDSSSNHRIPIGTQLLEVREKKRKKRAFRMRRIVTNIKESPSTNEYSISFISQFEDEIPNSADVLCNTSTLSIIPSKSRDNKDGVETDNKTDDDNCCELVGSLAVEVGGSGSSCLTSCCMYFPILIHLCCKKRLQKHAEYHFESELQNYCAEAERRYNSHNNNNNTSNLQTISNTSLL